MSQLEIEFAACIYDEMLRERRGYRWEFSDSKILNEIKVSFCCWWGEMSESPFSSASQTEQWTVVLHGMVVAVADAIDHNYICFAKC